MTDKLYFGAATAARLNPQTNTFMRTKLIQKLGAAIALGALLSGAPQMSAQLSIGPAGTGVQTFTAQPTIASGWSTLSLAGGAGDYTTAGNLDNHVTTNTIFSAVNVALASSTTLPPSANAIARWNNAATGLYLQTRPTGNAYLLLLNTLTNNTGSNITHVKVEYDWDQKHPLPNVEEIPGHRAFYSLTGERNSWTLIPAFSTFTVNDTAQHLTATLPVTGWTNGARLYILWADDNGSAGTETNSLREGSYTIDNYQVTAVPATTPAIAQHPQPQSVAPGGSLVLSVSAIGASPLTYYWRLNSNVISVGSSPTYTVNNAALINQGFYSVIVSNGFGSATSSNAFVTVSCASAVAVTAQPVDQAIGTGATLSLSVGSSGTAPVSYQWYRNDVPLANATNSTYTKANAQIGDSGLYRVVANNCAGVPAISSNAVVSVTPPPVTLLGLTNHVWRYNQANVDLGTAWRAANYVEDASWFSGRGLLAFEDNAVIVALTNTVLNLTNGVTSIQTPTFYFRTQFVFTNDASLIALVATNYFDDGAVVYLNGVEALRFNIAAGAVNHNTLAQAANPQGEGTFMISNLAPGLLVQGTNTIAVEVHQNSLTSSDIAFGISLAAVYLPFSQLVITNQPQDVIVEETKEIRLTLGLQGQPAYFQWYYNGVAISNGTFNPLVIPIASTNDSGSYFVVATNSINSVTSSIVNVTVYPDTNAPVLVEADGTLFMTNVLVSFSERITLTTATNVNNYRITNTVGGATLSILRATLVDGTNVLLHTSARTAGQNYILVVNNLRDVSPSANLITANSSIPVRSLVSIIPLSQSWEFYNPIPFYGDPPNLGTAWKEFNYTKTNAWGSGVGILWDMPDTSLIPGPVGDPMSNSDGITSYFRSDFNFQASPGGLRLALTHVVDDGGIFYLNGQEILRYNLPTGPVFYDTPASTSIGTLARVGPATVSAASLRSGANVLAFELHTFVPLDIDKNFGVQLDASVQSFAIGPVVITSGPQDVTVVEGSTATFKVVQAGGASFQWQSNSVNIAGATNDTYSIPNVPLNFNGRLYRVIVNNTTPSSATSTNARLNVVPDTNGPAIYSALAGPNTIVVTFTEPVTSASAQNIANYAVTNSAGSTFIISGGAVLNNGTNVTLSFALLPPGSYFVTVNNIRDTSVATNLIAPNSTVKVGYAAQVVAFNGSWRYDAAAIDRGAGSVWGAPSYNDSGWTGTGNGLLVGDTGAPPNFGQPIGTTLPLFDPGNVNRLSTYYFRTHFNSYAAGSGTLSIDTILDDGAVIYLNGVEVFRLGVANNVAPNYATLANRTVGDATREGPFTVPVTNILGGDNVIAVSAHQVNLTSSDIVWGGQFSVNIPSINISGGSCIPSPVTPVRPPLTVQRSGTNIVLTWPSAPVVTNTCGATAVFRLQRAFYLSNAPSSIVWSNVTTVSPYTNAIPTNTVPIPGGASFFRLSL
jgi:hypothetical protein